MKKVLCVMLAVVLALSLVGCGGKEKTPDLPSNDQIKADLQDYISEMIDPEGKVNIFERTEDKLSGGRLEIACNVLYELSDGQQQSIFRLTYEQSNNKWELTKCRVESEEVAEEKEDQAEPTQPAKGTDEAAMSDDLFDFTFTLDGVVYQLPCPYEKFTENGWTIASRGYSTESLVAANNYEMVKLAKNGVEFYAYFINLSGNAKAMGDCKIGGADFDARGLGDPSLLAIAKGITVESTQDEIVAAFGSANTINSYDDYTSLSYGEDYQVRARFVCYNANASYPNNEIELKNYIKDESDVTETSTEVPAYLSEYVAPSELGSNLLSGNVELAGTVYTMPAPVSVFLADGWTITSKPSDVGAGNTESIRMQKGNKSAYFNVINGAEYQTIPENCVVYRVSVSESDGITMTLPGGVTFGTTKAELEGIISDDFSYYAAGSGSYASYSYDNYKINFSVSIRVDRESEKVSDLDLSWRNWHYGQ